MEEMKKIKQDSQEDVRASREDAVVEYSYVSIFKTKKAQKYGPDPLENLRKAWEHNTTYGLDNPILYALIVGDPRPGFPSPVTQKVQQRLGETIHQIALAGRPQPRKTAQLQRW